MRPKRVKYDSNQLTSNGLNEESEIRSSDGDHKKTVRKKSKANDDNTNSNDCQQSNCVNDSSAETESQTTDPLLNYTPKLFLRCHCKRNDPFDNSTAIWSAAFQPKTNNGSDGNQFVATCGANMVCIIDCQKPMESSDTSVIARFIDDNENEDFVSLAWSVVPMGSESESSSQSETLILAVGGKTTICLLSDLNHFHCYERLKDSHSDQINALLFTKKDLLFSASYDRTIKMWRISRPKDKTLTQLLRTIETKDCLLSLSFSYKYDTLLASGEKGVFLWSSAESAGNEVLAKIKTNNLVDGLHVIPEDEDSIAIRVHLSKSIAIIDLKKAIEEMKRQSNSKCELKHILLSKVLKGKLKSFEFDFPYIYLSAKENLLASGGPDGQIWLYNTQRFKNCYQKNESGKPDRVLDWPLLENITKDKKTVIDDKMPVIVNTVAISPDLKYLIACTQMNLLCIWHKT